MSLPPSYIENLPERMLEYERILYCFNILTFGTLSKYNLFFIISFRSQININSPIFLSKLVPHTLEINQILRGNGDFPSLRRWVTSPSAP